MVAETQTDIERSHQKIDIEDDLVVEVHVVAAAEAGAVTETVASAIDTPPLDDLIVREVVMIETMDPAAIVATERAQPKKTVALQVVA